MLPQQLLVLLLLADACTNLPQQQPNAKPWTGCASDIGRNCTAACAEGLSGPGFNAICAADEGGAAWTVYGSCSGSRGDLATFYRNALLACMCLSVLLRLL
jgi:hypothetical protein